ncbi:phage tail sheath C-terminal domain-containing protein [Viridibacillus sp. NPDC096237]|uniref:phage tail sheath C-terminal domain-containing protein n=1 Tax=Viridibacillus sp. NPDC096237 TaxID=3390721 RepID=UPI003CFDE2FA
MLECINTFTNDKNEDFSSNQTIRVLDQISNNIVRLFATNYLGKEQNDAASRISLWNDITTLHKERQTLRAFENFNSEDVTVQLAQLYLTVMVS